MPEFIAAIIEVVRRPDFWLGVLQTMLGLFSFGLLVALFEWRRTTKRLRRFVTSYIEAVEFEWQNQTKDFVVMHRVRAFEVLLRNVQSLQPRTPGAYQRVEEVRDALEYLHKCIPIFRGEHLPLPSPEQFPVEPNSHTEPQIRAHVLRNLRSIGWLRLKSSQTNKG